MTVSIETKLKLKADRTDVATGTRLEIHHVVPQFQGGNGDEDNLKPVTLVEHALEHLADAQTAEDWQVARGHYASVTLIVKRMSPEEKAQFNRVTR